MQEKDKNSKGFESLDVLLRRWREGTFHEILEDWKWIFSYSSRYKGAIAFYTILGIISTTMGLVSSIAGKYLIDLITGYDRSRLGMMLAILVGSSLGSLVFQSLVSRISAKLSIDIHNDIQADIFDRILDADWLELSRYSSGDILNRFNGDIGTVSTNAISWLPTIVIAVYRFFATFFVILYYDWVMAAIAFISAPILLLMSRFVLKAQREYGKKTREMSSRLMTFEAETFYNMDTIKSFGIASSYGSRMRDWQRKFKKVSLDYNLFSIRTNVWMSLLGMVVNLAAFGYCLFRLWTHSITYGTMTLFLQQRGNLSDAFNNMVSIIPAFLNSSVSAHRIRELVELPREKHRSEDIPAARAASEGLSVEMRGVDFSYVQDRTILKDSTFFAAPGEIVALVGASGEGKTTLVRLMLGLIYPENGAVVLRAGDGVKSDWTESVRSEDGAKSDWTESVRSEDGAKSDWTESVRSEDGAKSDCTESVRMDDDAEPDDARNLQAANIEFPVDADTRRLFAYVPQGNTILTGTIAENLRMGKEDASEAEMQEALTLACAWEFVSKLPEGMHTELGERGRGLSEGQAQRLAIARAVLRDAPILILDEATSALDVATERAVLRSIVKQRPDKTVIVTTHRPSVLNLSQRVYRVMDGHVTELDEESAARMAMEF